MGSATRRTLAALLLGAPAVAAAVTFPVAAATAFPYAPGAGRRDQGGGE
jgi:uncharacterized RDD family membrane protein YckC